MSNFGYIHSIETFGAVDGPGIRYVVFLQGCPLRCLYCHNPDSWHLKDGKKTTVKQIINDIKPYYNYIKNGGVTLSGGEPLMQHQFCFNLVKELKKLNLHVALDTAGSLDLRFSKKIIDLCDLILLDIKAHNNEMSKVVTGFENKNTLKTLQYCESINKPVWIRHVVLSNYTLNYEYLEELALFLKDYKCIEKIELVPFHKMGEFKWKELNLDYKLYDTPSPTNDEMAKVKQIFKKHNLKV